MMFSTAANRLLPAVAFVFLAIGTAASAQVAPGPDGGPTHPTIAPAPRAYAVIVTGIPGTPLYARRFADWATRFHAYLTGPAGIPAAHVTTLCGDKDFKDPWVTSQATAQSIHKTLSDLAKRVRADDQFTLVLIGHGQAGDSEAALLVPGPALSAKALAQDLNEIPACTQVVLNLAGAAGDMVKDLARGGRVNIAATGLGEEVEPVFAEFFLLGLETKAADGEAPVSTGEPATIAADGSSARPRPGVKDGRVSMLEAYNWAARETAYWVGRQRMDDDESWIVEGSQSVAIFKKLCLGDANDPGARRLSDKSDASATDVAVPPPTAQADPHDPWWLGRRVLMEHPSLEDCGQEAAASALRGNGYEPLDGVKDNQPGNLARRVVLGRPALLQVEAER